MFRFSKDQKVIAILEDLEREWREHDPGHAVHVALANRVAFTMLIVVGCAFSHSRQIRKFSTWRVDDDARTRRRSIGCSMLFHVECGGQACSHPDTAEVWMPVGKAGRSKLRLHRGAYRQD